MLVLRYPTVTQQMRSNRLVYVYGDWHFAIFFYTHTHTHTHTHNTHTNLTHLRL